jgi:hypothetical protein
MKYKIISIFRILFSKHYLLLSQNKKQRNDGEYTAITHFCCPSCELEVVLNYLDIHEQEDAIREAKHIIKN